jgi:hypothetical protein
LTILRSNSADIVRAPSNTKKAYHCLEEKEWIAFEKASLEKILRNGEEVFVYIICF